MTTRWFAGRRWYVPAVVGGALLGAGGCTFFVNGVRNAVTEPGKHIAEYRLRNRHDHYAHEAWRAMVGQYPEPEFCFSQDYKDGFIDGFADYLNYGGTGEPPSSPPPHYWKPKYATPAGMQAIEEWFVGFRHGAATAIASNLRELSTLPVVNPPDFNYTQQLQPWNSPAGGGVSGSPNAPTGNTAPATPLPSPAAVTPAAPPQSPPGVGGPVPTPNAPANPMPPAPPVVTPPPAAPPQSPPGVGGPVPSPNAGPPGQLSRRR